MSLNRVVAVLLAVAGLACASSALAATEAKGKDLIKPPSEQVGANVGGKAQLDVRPDPGNRNRRIDVEPVPRDSFRIQVWTDESSYDNGDRVRVYFRSTRDCYLYLFNTDVRGAERQIFPNYYDHDNFVRGGRTYYIPDASHSRYQFVVSGPSGREYIRAVAVAERYDVCRQFDRFGSSNDPYPLRKGGFDMMLRALQDESKSSSRDNGVRKTPSKKPTSPSKKPAQGRLKQSGGSVGSQGSAKGNIGGSGQAIRVEPRPDPRRRPEPTRRYSYAEDEVSFRVRGDRDDYWYEPRPDRYGSLSVRSSPSSARVYLDGRYIGRTPETIDGVSYGRHTLRIERDGYRDHSQTVHVYSSARGNVFAVLRSERRDHGRSGIEIEIPLPPLPPLPPFPF